MADIRKRLTEYLRELHLPTIRRKFEEEARRAERETLSYEAGSPTSHRPPGPGMEWSTQFCPPVKKFTSLMLTGVSAKCHVR